MPSFFKMLFQEQESLGVGRTTNSVGFALPYAGYVDKWTVPTLKIQDGDYPDYLASNLGCRLCSERLKGLLSRHCSASDVLQWLEVRVQKDGQERVYYMLHFPIPPDVLHKTKTIFAGADFVVKPVLSKTAVGDHRVFTYPKNEGLPLFVSAEVKLAIEFLGCTGIEFSRVPIA
jgi:hypothetical protein